MNTRYVTVLAISGVLGVAGAAAAQTPYVSASLTGDVVRTTQSEFGNVGGTGGEAVGFALRVGTALGSNWGVELEYARPSVIKNRDELIYPLPASLVPDGGPGVIPERLPIPGIYPPIFPIPLATETRDRHSTISALLWANQSVSDRVALVYLGGVAFNQFEREYSYAFDLGLGLLAAPRTIRYSAHPIVGFESWIGLTDRVTLMPGIRMRTVPGGWSVRPAVGLGWSF